MAALLCTAAAGFGAALAVVGFVLFTLGSAGIADLGTQAAQLGSELRAATHPPGGRPADLRAVSIKANALSHFLDVTLAQTCVGTMLALLSTLHASLDT